MAAKSQTRLRDWTTHTGLSIFYLISPSCSKNYFSKGIRERRSVLGVHWKDWYWSWNSSTLATWYDELTHWKRLWCWERLRAGGEGDNRRWDGWMATPTRWTWVWVNSGSWWWRGRPGHAAVHGVAKSRTRLSGWTELKGKENWSEIQYRLGKYKMDYIFIESTIIFSPTFYYLTPTLRSG